MNKNHCVYLLKPNKGYIGQTNNFRCTWNRHTYIKNKYPIACAIRKYGIKNTVTKILHNNLTQAQANIWEIIEISNHNSFANGYNLTLGGDGKSGYKHSAKTKQLIGTKSKGRYFSPEARKKISIARIGNQNALGSHPNRTGQHKGNQFAKGKHWYLSEETKAKHRGKKHSAKTRVKISKGNKGKIVSAETRAKMSKSATGRKNPAVSEANKNRIWSVKSRTKMSKSKTLTSK